MIEYIVNLMLTEECNLRCKYCYQPKGMRSNKEMTSQIANDSITYLKKNFKTGFTVMLYGGEPLLRFDLIKEIMNNNPQIQFKMLTNGVKLTEEMGEFFYQHRDHIALVWSAEGFKANENNVNFSTVQDQVRPMLNLIKKLRFGVHLVISDPEIMLDDFRFLYESGFRSFKLSMPRKWELEDSKLEIYRQNMFNITDLIYNGVYKDASIMLWDKFSSIYQGKENPLYHELPYFCGTGDHTFTITTNGDIYPCDWFYALGEFRLGNIYDKDPNLKSIFTEYSQNPILLNKVCKDCDIYHICTRGMCLAENFELNKDLLSPTKYWCKLSHIEAEILSYLASKQKGVMNGSRKNNMC